ncbi:acyltransferase [Domibacillus mangrovi]|nr:acyltransferase [Domibacillus mangrovi]
MKTILYQLRWALPLWTVIFITGWLPDNKISLKVRGKLASFFIKNCGKNFLMGRDVTLLNTNNLTIGDNVYIAKGCWINAMGGLKIENEVIVAPYVVISTLQHVYQDYSVRFGGSIAAPVRIGRGTWLAAHVSVKCGVSIGKGNLIAANAFVANDTEDHAVMGGVPAKKISDVKNQKADFYNRSEFEKSN